MAIANLVQETANAPSNAATVTLAGPSPGRRGIIAAFGAGATVYLGMEDGTQWQLVEALTVAGPPQQITITTVINNSAGTTNRLNFTGSVRIYSAIPAERNVYARPDGSVPLTGDVIVSKATPRIFLDRPNASTIAAMQGRVSGADRWRVELGNSTAETGGNAGSDFAIARSDDAGAFIDAPLLISRATGVAAFTQRPTHAGVPLAVQPTSSAGPGQVIRLESGVNNALNLPAGGTWRWWLHNINQAGGTIAGFVRDISAGGTQVAVATPGINSLGEAERIA